MKEIFNIGDIVTWKDPDDSNCFIDGSDKQNTVRGLRKEYGLGPFKVVNVTATWGEGGAGQMVTIKTNKSKRRETEDFWSGYFTHTQHGTAS